MKKSTIIKHVLIEIENIKKFATKEQKNRLNFMDLNPATMRKCIYGQMCGSCYNEAATELIKKCCSRTTTIDVPYDMEAVSERLDEIFSPKNVRDSKGIENYDSFNSRSHHSFLELFISYHPQNNKDILAYIQGDSDNLVLTM